MARFEGKSVVVLGGATGIGAATVRRFVSEGARVWLGDINEAGARDLAESIGAGGRLATRFADQSQPDSIFGLIDAAISDAGKLDVLFLNGAATGTLYQRDSNIVDVDINDFRQIMEVNLYGYLNAARHAIPAMVSAGGGAIICTSSEAAISTNGTVPAYVISKSAVNGLVRHIAAHYGKAGIRCNAILPGLILTETMEKVTTQEQRDYMLNTLNSTRIGLPDDIAGMVLHLASDDGHYINGQMISVNGGSRM